MSLHYLVKYECQKTGANLKKSIVLNDKSQDSIAKHLSCDELLHYKFIIQFAGKKFLQSVNIGEVTSKWLIMSYAPFALDFCPQRCRTRQISKMTCV